MHKHSRRIQGIDKYLTNQLVIRMACFPRALSGRRKDVTQALLGRFSPKRLWSKEWNPVVNVMTLLEV